MSETPVVLPKWGLTMLDATLVEWLKQEGERVEVDDAICLVETDKVDAEVTAPVAGVLGPLLVHEGRRGPGRRDADDDPRGRRLARRAHRPRDHRSARHRGGRGPALGAARAGIAARWPAPRLGHAQPHRPARRPLPRDPRRGGRERGPARPHGTLAAREHRHRRPADGVVLRDGRHRAALAPARAGARARRPRAARRLAPLVARRRARQCLGARPFFIAWDEPEMRPGLLGAPHAVEVRGISRVEVGCTAERAGRLGRRPTVPVRRWATTAGCARS